MLIPTFFVRDIAEGISFYTRVLDFKVTVVMNEDSPFFAILTRGADELHLTLNTVSHPCGHGSATLVCDGVDSLFSTFRARGLSVPNRPDSPVHQGPLDQTWGTREFYIDDPSGNTLCFQQR